MNQKTSRANKSGSKSKASGGGSDPKKRRTVKSAAAAENKEPQSRRPKIEVPLNDEMDLIQAEDESSAPAGEKYSSRNIWNNDGLIRCPWALISSRMAAYHDLEWGIPSRDDRHIFKMLILEGMQAGLSWAVILRKSEFLEEAFDGFDPEKIAGYKSDKVEKLMSNPDIIRNKLKINAVISNAAAYLKLRREEGSLSDFLWKFVDDKPIINNWKVMSEVPSKTTLSDKISQELKKRGFKFVGSTIVYSLMQSIGLVNDHLKECSFRFKKPNPLPVLEGKTAPAK